jgi:hypothetical protein
MSAIHRHAPTAARYLLGLIFFVFGLNFFLNFLPQPPMTAAAGAFAGALMASGYVMPIVKAIEVIAGALLLGNRFVPLALALLAPIVVGINGFHVALAPAAGGAAYLALALELFLAWSYRHAFAPMLAARVQPTSSLIESRAPRASSPTAGAAHA